MMLEWMLLVTTVAGFVGTAFFFTLFMRADSRANRARDALHDEQVARRELRDRYNQLRSSGRSDPFHSEVVNRDDVDEIRERYRDWTDIDDKDDGWL